MRELKFRGKLGEDWWYVTPDDEAWEHFWSLVDRSTVGQYIGRADKHGKGIYEGDIVKSHTPFDHWADNLSVVKYEDGSWNYSYALQEFSDKPEKDWEVIGNIYEHGDLLK